MGVEITVLVSGFSEKRIYIWNILLNGKKMYIRFLIKIYVVNSRLCFGKTRLDRSAILFHKSLYIFSKIYRLVWRQYICKC